MPNWGMVVDLDRCTGCEACVVACHAENNIPTVGPLEAAQGRAHHWIRVERYWEGEYPEIKARFLPVFCQQCEAAPCETVCPVYATYHSREGLNAQVYNRCVGTRSCANSCPYTVRFFNWFDPEWPTPLDEQLNPDVSIRRRGVMEKCTFCVQRIRRAEDTAQDKGGTVRDGEANTACAQACPADALVFGDSSDPASRVSKLAGGPNPFDLLEETGAHPKVVYLKRRTTP